VLVAAVIGSWTAMLVYQQRGEDALRSERLAVDRQRQTVVESLVARAETHKVREERSRAVALLRAAVTLETPSQDGTATSVGRALEELGSRGGLSRVLPGAHPVIDEVAYSPDGTRIGTVGGERLGLWDARSGALLGNPKAHDGRMTMLAWAPDSTWVATGAIDDPAIKTWSRDGALLKTLTGPEPRGRYVAVAGDGRSLASAHIRTVVLWDPATGQKRHTLSGHEADVRPVAFSADSALLASGDHRGHVRVWDVRSGALRHQLAGQSGQIFRLAFGKSGVLAATSFDGTVGVWNAETGQALHTLAHRGRVWSAAFDDADAQLVSGSGDYCARLWDVPSGAMTLELCDHEASVYDAALSPDGKALVSASADGKVRYWDPRSGVLVERLAGHGGILWRLDYAPDGRRFVTASEDGTARIWELDRAGLETQLNAKAGQATLMSMTADGSRLAVPYADGTTRIWTQDGALKHVLSGHTSRVWATAFAFSGRRLATTSVDRTAIIWDVAEGSLRYVLKHDEIVAQVAWSPDDAELATMSVDGSLSLWRTTDGTLRSRTKVLGLAGQAVIFSPDGALLAAATSHGAEVALIDAKTATIVRRWPAHRPRADGVRFSHDSSRLVTTGADGAARLWDRQGRPLHALTGHSNPTVLAATFSPDDAFIATSDAGGGVWIWSADTGGLTHALTPHDDSVPALAYVGDGGTLVSASTDGTLRFWDTATGRLNRTIAGDENLYGPLLVTPDSKRIIMTSTDGATRIWRVPRDSEPALTNTGRRTNLRVCRDTLKIVPVVPFPEPATVWAPQRLCPAPD